MHTVNLPSITSLLLMDALGEDQDFGGGSVCSGRLSLNLSNHSAELGSQLALHSLCPIHLTRMRIAGLHHQ
jgi:hypothetical protein